MKKIISFVAMAVATLAMTTSVFAAPSSSTVTGGKDCTVKAVTTEQKAAIDKVVSTTDAVKEVLNKSTVITGDATLKALVADKTPVVLATADVEGTAGKAFTLNVSGVKAGDTVVLLHWVGGKMDATPEVVKATTGNGTVTATFASFSPVAIVKLADASTSVSPKTADNGVATAMVVALVAAAGIAVVSKKKTVVR